MRGKQGSIRFQDAVQDHQNMSKMASGFAGSTTLASNNFRLALACLIAMTAVGKAQEPLAQLEHERTVHCFAFAPNRPDKKTLLASAAENKVYLWDYSSGNPFVEPRSSKYGNVLALAFSPDGSQLAIGCNEDVLVWDVSDPTKIRVVAELDLPKDAYSADHLSFSGDGKKLNVSPGLPNDRGLILEWTLDTEKRRVLCELSAAVMGLAQSAESKELLAVVIDGSNAKLVPVSQYSGKQGRSKQLSDATAVLTSASIFADDLGYKWPIGAPFPCRIGFANAANGRGARLLVCLPYVREISDLEGAGLYLWDLKNGGPREEKTMYIRPPRENDTPLYVFCAALSGDGNRVAMVVWDPLAKKNRWAVQFYNVSDSEAKPAERFVPHEGMSVTHVGFSPDGKQFATSSFADNPVLTLWDLKKVWKGGGE